MAVKHNFFKLYQGEDLSEYCENTVDTWLTPLQCPRHEAGGGGSKHGNSGSFNRLLTRGTFLTVHTFTRVHSWHLNHVLSCIWTQPLYVKNAVKLTLFHLKKFCKLNLQK